MGESALNTKTMHMGIWDTGIRILARTCVPPTNAETRNVAMLYTYGAINFDLNLNYLAGKNQRLFTQWFLP